MLSATELTRYYDILGVSKTSTLEEIKQAYRQLARQHHPDLNAGNKESEATFKLINEAYQILSEPNRYSQPANSAQTTSPKAAANTTASQEFNLEEYSNFNDFVYDLLGYFLQDPITGKQVSTPRNSKK